MTRINLRAFAVALALPSACGHSVALEPDPTATGGSGGTGPAGTPSPVGGGEPGTAGPQAARRLSLFEYRNTLRDLVGYDIPAGMRQEVTDLWNRSGFPTGAAVEHSAEVRGIVLVAEAASRQAVQDLSTLLPATCRPPPDAAAETACAFQLISNFGPRAFRRPLAPEELDALRAVYMRERAAPVGGDFTDGIRVLISAMLQSPPFLYRWELRDAPIRDGALVRFGPYEIASRLSYLFWSTMPDADLFAAAAAGRLETPDQIEVQARRLLADSRARSTMTEFHQIWLQIDGVAGVVKDPSILPSSSTLPQSMLDEASAFVTALMVGPAATGKLASLLTSSRSFINPDLAALYGVPDSAAGLHPAELDPTQRAGILTQGAFLAVHARADLSNPTERGEILLEQVLCQPLEIPANVDIPSTPPPSPQLTTRRAVESVVNDPCTGACHMVYDAGFAFENYNAVGAYRQSEPGGPVDASGILHLASGDLPFANAVELVHALASREEVVSCLPRQWLRFLTRRPEVPADQPSLDAVTAAFRNSSYDMREILVALARSRAFTHRTPAIGEVLP
jgi:hypothetical protein